MTNVDVVLTKLIEELEDTFKVEVQLQDSDRVVGQKIGQRDIIQYLKRKVEEKLDFV